MSYSKGSTFVKEEPIIVAFLVSALPIISSFVLDVVHAADGGVAPAILAFVNGIAVVVAGVMAAWARANASPATAAVRIARAREKRKVRNTAPVQVSPKAKPALDPAGVVHAPGDDSDSDPHAHQRIVGGRYVNDDGVE